MNVMLVLIWSVGPAIYLPMPDDCSVCQQAIGRHLRVNDAAPRDQGGGKRAVKPQEQVNPAPQGAVLEE